MTVRHSILAIAAAVMPLAAATAQQPLVTTPVPTTPIGDDFTLAAAGDLIYLRPMLATLEARSPDMVRLLREADVSFGNFETTVLDLADTKAVAQAESGGTWMLADPRVPDDIAKLGFDMVSHANNHSTDWGVEGMIETGRRLTDANIVWSGTGTTMSGARAPRYLDVAKGRVAIVSATSTFTPMSRASDPVGEVAGRPGANTIRTVRTTLVTPEQFAAIGDLAAKSPLATDSRTDEAATLFGNRFAPGDTGGKHLDFRYRIHAGDLADNMRAIRQARQNGNFVIYSVHNHEPGNAFQEPADFAIELAHAVIDAGHQCRQQVVIGRKRAQAGQRDGVDRRDAHVVGQEHWTPPAVEPQIAAELGDQPAQMRWYRIKVGAAGRNGHSRSAGGAVNHGQ